jgi:hypothetical protein
MAGLRILNGGMRHAFRPFHDLVNFSHFQSLNANSQNIMKTPWFEEFLGKARPLWVKPRESHIKYTYEV